MFLSCNLFKCKKVEYGAKSLWILSVLVVLWAGVIDCHAAEKATRVLRSRIYSLKHLPSAEAKQLLGQLKIGQTVSEISSTNALIVTSDPQDLIKTTSVIRLIDSEHKFIVKVLDSANEPLPSSEQIELMFSGVSIGTFMQPPVNKQKAQAIVAKHNSQLIVISTAELAEEIADAIKILQKPDLPRAALEQAESEVEKEITEPESTEPNAGEGQVEDDELFQELFESLAEAEKAAEIKKESAKKIEAETEVVVEETEKVEDQVESPQEIPPGLAEALKALTEKAVTEKQIEPAIPESVEPFETEELAEVEAEKPAAAEAHGFELIIPNGEELLQLDLPERVEIVALLDLVGKYLQINYLYDPAKITGDVTLKMQGPIKLKDLYGHVEEAMKFKGFVMSRKGNLVTIVPVAEVLAIDPTLRTDREAIQPGDVVVTRVFRLKHIDTGNAVNLLNNMKLGLNIMPIPEMGALIITNNAYRMERNARFLEMNDKPGPVNHVESRQI